MHRHEFSNTEIPAIRIALLKWYSENKRQLPWREVINNPDRNVRAYSIWVSEIMLQQTQVATVLDYYKRWMEKWPTVSDLAKASSEEVLQMWSGLGYYSRAKRLHEGAKMVEEKLGGVIPQSASELQKLPGIGRYSACAIASLTFHETKGVVDGNVIRVLTRLRSVGLETNDRRVINWLWQTVDDLVDRDEPGEFNQAIMELGALVCTPKSPSCSSCPLNSYCWALRKSNVRQHHEPARKIVTMHSGLSEWEMASIECVPHCDFCLKRDDLRDHVTIYPRKNKKKEPREERVAVAVIRNTLSTCESPKYLITKRPDKGLLANLWEFPSVTIKVNDLNKVAVESLVNLLSSQFFGSAFKFKSRLKLKGQVLHVFSHIRCTYVVYSLEVQKDLTFITSCPTKWVTELELKSTAVSTAMKKIFRLFKD